MTERPNWDAIVDERDEENLTELHRKKQDWERRAGGCGCGQCKNCAEAAAERFSRYAGIVDWAHALVGCMMTLEIGQEVTIHSERVERPVEITKRETQELPRLDDVDWDVIEDDWDKYDEEQDI